MNKRHVPGNRLRLGRLMCGRSLTFRSNLGYFGATPQNSGHSPRDFNGEIPVRQSLTAHQAAEPRG